MKENPDAKKMERRMKTQKENKEKRL